MILAAAALVLAGVALFVAGVVTDATVWYWACVAVSGVAAVLLLLARRQLSRTAPAAAPRPSAAPGGGRRRADRRRRRGAAAGPESGEGSEPPAEEVAPSDEQMVRELQVAVFVVDEHPRYHLEECPFLIGQDGVRIPLDQARGDGFTPCGLCAPDRRLASDERERRDRDQPAGHRAESTAQDAPGAAG